MNYQKLIPVVVIFASLFSTGCSTGEGAPVAAAAPGDVAGAHRRAEPPRPVRFIQAGMSERDEMSSLPGEVRPRFEQRYAFRIGGKIARRLVDVGQEVRAGQVLAVLDAQDVMPAINAQAAQVEVARSDFKLQQSELKRQSELREKGFLSRAALDRQAAATDAAQSRLQAAQSQLASAQNGLEFQTLRADKAGIVAAVDAEAGGVVAPGQSVVRVAQLGQKEIAVNVPEGAVALMQKAAGYSASFDALGGKRYEAKLRELSPVADPASRTFAARFSIIDAGDAVKLGMSAKLRMAFGSGQAIAVPNSALYTRDDKTRVWLVDRASETVSSVVVELGESTNDGVKIVSGLKPGDLVVTAGANLLLAGQKVRLLEASAAAMSAGKSAAQP